MHNNYYGRHISQYALRVLGISAQYAKSPGKMYIRLYAYMIAGCSSGFMSCTCDFTTSPLDQYISGIQ